MKIIAMAPSEFSDRVRGELWLDIDLPLLRVVHTVLRPTWGLPRDQGSAGVISRAHEKARELLWSAACERGTPVTNHTTLLSNATLSQPDRPYVYWMNLVDAINAACSARMAVEEADLAAVLLLLDDMGVVRSRRLGQGP